MGEDRAWHSLARVQPGDDKHSLDIQIQPTCHHRRSLHSRGSPVGATFPEGGEPGLSLVLGEERTDKSETEERTEQTGRPPRCLPRTPRLLAVHLEGHGDL